jgi:transcriptional regulator with XRE-family HTH domain
MSKKLIPISGEIRPTFIRKWRKAKGLTLADVADRTDATLATISRIELGQSNLTWSALNAIANALCVEPYDLLFRDPDGSEIEDLISEIRQATPEKQALILKIVRATLDS